MIDDSHSESICHMLHTCVINIIMWKKARTYAVVEPVP